MGLGRCLQTSYRMAACYRSFVAVQRPVFLPVYRPRFVSVQKPAIVAALGSTQGMSDLMLQILREMNAEAGEDDEGGLRRKQPLPYATYPH